MAFVSFPSCTILKENVDVHRLPKNVAVNISDSNFLGEL